LVASSWSVAPTACWCLCVAARAGGHLYWARSPALRPVWTQASAGRWRPERADAWSLAIFCIAVACSSRCKRRQAVGRADSAAHARGRV